MEETKMSKIGINELAAVLAGKHGLEQAKAEIFVRQVFDVINDGLRNEKLAKIKGLGTFKVTSVSARKSVDVNTGEAIIIEGRDKISFTADSVMKDIVNAPFAQFETVVVNDGVDFSGIDEKYKDEMVASDEGNEETVTAEIEVSVPGGLIQTTDKEENSQNYQSQDDIVSEETSNNDEGNLQDETPDAEETPQDEPQDVKNEEARTEDNGITASVLQKTISPNEDEVLLPKWQADRIISENDNLVQANDRLHDALRAANVKARIYIYIIVALVIAMLSLFYFLNNELQRRDKRIEHLEAQTSSMVDHMIKSQASVIDSVAAKARRDSIEEARKMMEQKKQQEEMNAKKAEAEKVANVKSAEVNPVHKKEASASQAKVDRPAAKVETVAAPAKTSKPVVNNAEYNKDPRVRTGAYIITGIASTVTVRKGQTIASISKSHLGPGMECYVEAVNGGKKTVAVGDKVNIPALKLKGKK
ncbi:MAG: HU family DNA-binding protein [Prevotella sp.]|nr:HU family DNA-binding protein [Prevotella sp.]MCI6462153.1 HU family DNA-binding protein [Prevotella sp.]